MTEQLEDGQEGDELPVRRAVALVDGEAPRRATLGELAGEPALAHARLADQADHLSLSGDRPLERAFKTGHLLLASDEAREAPRLSDDLEAGAERPRALERVDPQRLAHALHGEGAQVAQTEVVRDELCRVLRQVRRTGIGELLHPGREPDRVALRGVLHVQVVPDRPHHDLARVETHADGEADPPRPLELLGVAPELVLQVQRRVACPPGVVLVRDRRAEERHHAVAGVLIHRTLEAVHAVGEELEEAIHDLVPVLGVEPLGELHGALDVGEEHGHLLQLAF